MAHESLTTDQGNIRIGLPSSIPKSCENQDRKPRIDKIWIGFGIRNLRANDEKVRSEMEHGVTEDSISSFLQDVDEGETQKLKAKIRDS